MSFRTPGMIGSAVFIRGKSLIRSSRFVHAPAQLQTFAANDPALKRPKRAPTALALEAAGQPRSSNGQYQPQPETPQSSHEMRWRMFVGIEHNLYPINDRDDRHLTNPAP